MAWTPLPEPLAPQTYNTWGETLNTAITELRAAVGTGGLIPDPEHEGFFIAATEGSE